MSKRLKVYLLVALAAACIACTLAGCKIGRPGRGELLAGYNTHVTYYSNGGSFNKSTSLSVRELYFKGGDDGVPFFDMTAESSGMTVERRAFDLIGWYLPETYPEGGAHAGEVKYTYTYTPDPANPDNIERKPNFDLSNPDNITVYVFPRYNENGFPLTDETTDRPLFTREGKEDEILEKYISVECSETRIDSTYRVMENIDSEHGLIVCAKWLPSAKIRYQLVITDENGNEITGDTEYTTTDGKEKFKNGDELAAYTIVGEAETPQNRELKKIKGLSFVRTYMDEELTETVVPVQRPTELGQDDPVVYCRYIVGSWTVITGTDSAKVAQMFGNLDDENKKFYIIDDVNYAGSSIDLKRSGSVTGYSNATVVCDKPHTISNLKFALSSIGQSMTYSMFGEIGATFKVSGLTLSDIVISLPETNREFSFYAVCADASKSAAANINLEIRNITATYRGTPTIYNLDEGRTNWLFGSVTKDTEFLTEFTGLRLTGTNTFTQYQA